MTPPVYIEREGVRVCREKCSTCIFRPGNKMRLESGRVKQMVTDALSEEGGNIVCHRTLDWPAGAICRGFWDAYSDQSITLRLVKLTDSVVEVDPEEGEYG